MTTTKQCMAIAAVILGLTAAGCGKSGETNQAPASTATAPVATTAAQPESQAADITFKSDPDPVKTGENTFEAMVMQNGKPVDDATVSAEFYMPAMPAMKMPEMRMKSHHHSSSRDEGRSRPVRRGGAAGRPPAVATAISARSPGRCGSP